jgi:hypothetical protein
MVKDGDFICSQKKDIEFPLQRQTNHNAMYRDVRWLL